MLTTRKKRSIKSGLEKLRTGKWRQMVVWLHTSHVDDVEIVEAYLQKHEFDIGVVSKPIEKIDLAMALLILARKEPQCVGRIRIVISHNLKYATEEAFFSALKTVTEAKLPFPLLLYMKGIKVSVNEDTEMKEKIKAINSTALFTTDRHHIVMNFCSLATVAIVGETIVGSFMGTNLDEASLFDTKFAWKQCVSVLRLQDRLSLEQFLNNNPNVYCGKAINFRIIIFANDGEYKDTVDMVRRFSPFVPIIIFVSPSDPLIDPHLRSKIYDTQTNDAAVVPSTWEVPRLFVTSTQSDLLGFGLHRPLLWAPDVSAGLLISSQEKQFKLKGVFSIQSLQMRNVFKERRDCYIQLRKISPDQAQQPLALTPSSPRPGSSRNHSPDFVRTDIKMKELHPKWNNLTDIVDTPWKLNCSSDDIFYYDIINSEQKRSEGTVVFTVGDVLKQMAAFDNQLEITFPFQLKDRADAKLQKLIEKNASLAKTFEFESSSPRNDKKGMKALKSFREKKKEVQTAAQGTLTLVFKWLPQEEAANVSNAKKAHFGVPLLQSLNTAKSTGQQHVAIKICKHIEQEGLKQQGIFRINATQKVVQEMVAIVEKGEVLQLEQYKVIDISGVLKKYFKELPEPLITAEMFAQLKKIEQIKDLQDWEDVKIVQDVCNQMHLENREMLKTIIKCLADIAYWSDVNKMTSDNLALIWAPNLFLTRDAIDPALFLAQSKVASIVLTFIIDWAYDIYQFDKMDKDKKDIVWTDKGGSDEDESSDTEEVSMVKRSDGLMHNNNKPAGQPSLSPRPSTSVWKPVKKRMSSTTSESHSNY